jgi:polyisoprenyl-teichoic acid--peptidoglycan teichoic acid transferase
MSRTTARMARSRQPRDRVTLIVLIAFLVLATITAVLAFIWARSFFASWSMTPLPGAPGVLPGQNGGANSGNGSANASNIPTPAGPLQRETDPTPVPWDGTSRVTLLVMGLDYRDWLAGSDVPRTDSMILFSIDPMAKTAGMLSIPRDLWVNIPGMGYNKINTAYRWGEIYKLPGGGPGLAMKTVEQTLGVPVDYYALIDFNSFVKFIDEMGGLDMKIRQEITVDPIGPGNTRVLKPGTQTLDGATVLAYARNRYTANDDFDRSRRQQEVIMAIRNQVVNLHMLPTLIAKAPKLYQDIASGISTNLTLDQVIKLSVLASQIDQKNIREGVIGPPSQVEYATNPADGQDILIPVPDQIRILRDQVFSISPIVAPVTQNGKKVQNASPTQTGDPILLMKAEKARVIIMNGTSTTGLASKTGEALRAQGVNIVGEDNADNPCATTTFKDYTGKPFTITFLQRQLNVPNSIVRFANDPKAPADIEICLGANYASQQK